MEDSASSSDAVPRSPQSNCIDPVKVAYSITYALPGQVVFCVPLIGEDPEYLENLQRLLTQESEITNKEVNPITGSLVISYKSASMSDNEMRVYLASLMQVAADIATNSQLKLDDEASLLPTDVDVEVASLLPTNVDVEVATQASTIQLPSQSVNDPQATEQPPQVTYTIVHNIPGRVRFHVPQVAKDPAYVQRLEALLQADPIVTSQRINQEAASVLITYKNSKLRSSQQDLQRGFAAAVSYFSALIESADIAKPNNKI